MSPEVPRRRLLQAIALSPVLGLALRDTAAAAVGPSRDSTQAPAPFPLEAVRLTASPYLAAVEANRTYLLSLEPDRLLHNFRTSAGLPAKGEVYGGWESESLAGHTLGHYLSACSLMFAQTAASECKRRVDLIVGELATCQAAHGDGYVAGFTRKRGDTVEDGKAIFAELARGDIRSAPFNLNGAWSPFYTLHKLLAGLLDAQRYCGNTHALEIATGLGGYLDRALAALSDDQLQQMLDTEFGGIGESFAEFYARTGESRWLKLAERFYHRKVLDPLADERDELSGLHSNTQVPKLIAAARVYELTGEARQATAARFFWQRVTRNRSYAIGGNSDRENFELPLSKFLTEQTCETCNTYNMLKLTRHLYAWRPDAAYFDYYERAHLNHILAHHHPGTGMFTYMMPMLSGARREFSTPTNDFWCCMGTGMESHSKHGDSIYWQDDDGLYVNLFIPSELTWSARNAKLALKTDYPFSGLIDLEVAELEAPQTFAVALRVPGWCENAGVSVNDRGAPARRNRGYLVLRRRWERGDRIRLTLPMRLRTEPIADDPNVVAFLHGPTVLAADLGPAGQPWSGPAPAVVQSATVEGIRPLAGRPGQFELAGASRPMNLSLEPFFQQYERRTAIYFARLTPAQWEARQAAYAAQETRERELDQHAVDRIRLGNDESERSHELAGISETILYRGRTSRLARKEGWFAFRMASEPGPLILQATYHGQERNRRFRILVDGAPIASQRLDGNRGETFFDVNYAIPPELTRDKRSILVRFEADRELGTGPVYGCRLLRA